MFYPTIIIVFLGFEGILHIYYVHNIMHINAQCMYYILIYTCQNILSNQCYGTHCSEHYY